ncbi:hypothetical protein GGI43DRAFT_382916 [Trichoderma evansii]
MADNRHFGTATVHSRWTGSVRLGAPPKLFELSRGEESEGQGTRGANAKLLAKAAGQSCWPKLLAKAQNRDGYPIGEMGKMILSFFFFFYAAMVTGTVATL